MTIWLPAFGALNHKLEDAKKAYVHCTAAALRAKESVLNTVAVVQENAEDILAEAKQINEERAAEEPEIGL